MGASRLDVVIVLELLGRCLLFRNFMALFRRGETSLSFANVKLTMLQEKAERDEGDVNLTKVYKIMWQICQLPRTPS